MKTAVIALLCSAVGAGVALVARDMMTSPVPMVAPHESSAATKSEVVELRGEFEQLSRDLNARRMTPDPVRVGVANDVGEQVGNLTARVEALEKQIAGIIARLDAMPQGVWSRLETEDSKPASPQKDELQRRLDATDMKNADALVELADWAAAQNMNTDAKRLLRLAVKADPDNVTARQRLGYTKYNGKWMTAREIEREKADGR
jgi:hypothetical protein